MNGFAILFLLLNSVALLKVPRRWGPLPLLIGACYMSSDQSISVGPFHFTVLRVLILLGVIRVISRHEKFPGKLNGLDWMMVLWGVALLCSSPFHKPFSEALVFRLGGFYNTLGFYFLIRVFCRTTEDLVQLIKLTAFLLVPVALEMILEKHTAHNYFAIFGGVSDEVIWRDGKVRAQGPFGHPILAGTVGALCIPFMIGIWNQHRRAAQIGIMACLGMVYASLSSGPMMSVIFGLLALGFWRWRHLTHRMRMTGLVGYFVLNSLMSSPAYYLMARIDLTGQSTGWHRARLIESAFEHLNEWWFAGTDYTRHWMPTGVSWSEDQTDITNQYIYYGVWGGLPLMLLFIATIWLAFRYVGNALRLRAESPVADQFLVWSLGAALFGHAATCLSVAYFDQSIMFLYLNLAAIGSFQSTESSQECEESGVNGSEQDSQDSVVRSGEGKPELILDWVPENAALLNGLPDLALRKTGPETLPPKTFLC